MKINILHIVMPSEDTKILEFNQYQKSDKAPFVIYADLVCLIEKIDGCKNNLENSFTTKVSECIPSDFSMFTRSLFKSISNRYDVQWNLSKANTYGTDVFVRFREVSALEKLELKSSQI